MLVMIAVAIVGNVYLMRTVGGRRVFAVGGIRPDNMAPWWAEGATGFGTGSNLYKRGADPAQVRAVAAAYRSGFAALPTRNRER